MTKKPVYIECPRCELNYILKKDKYCDVCKMEMKAGAIADEELELFDGLTVCPICRSNYLNEGETMCSTCLEDSLDEKEVDSEDWRSYVDKGEDAGDDELDILPVDEGIDDELDSTFAEDLDADFKDDFDELDSDEFELDEEDDFDLEDDLEDIEDDEDDEDDKDDY